MRTPWVVGVTGASGTPYAAAVLRGLLDAGLPVDLVVSRAARLTLLDETGVAFRDAHWKDDLAAWLGHEVSGDVTYWPAGDLAAGPSSGSYPTRGMV
ncbi:MAG: aromatic acid decarboxylase, partial [Actinobacteria bacterium]